MNIVIRRDSLKNMLFYIPYVAYLLYSLLNTSFYAKYINSYGKILFAFCVLLLLLKEFLGARFTSRDGILALVLMVITGYFYMYFGLTQTLLPIFIYSARNMEVNKILRISYIISVFMLVFIILSSYLGIIQNYIYYSALRERQYLGFRYALYPSSILCNIIFLKVYLEKENISWLSLICLLAANYVLFQYTDSRLTFILGVALIVFSTIMKKSQKFREILLNRTFIWSFLVLALLSIYATINYDYLSDWQSDLNEALGGRLSLGNSTLKFYGYGLFGKTLSLSGNGLDENGMLNTSTYDYVDNLYVLLLLRAGIIFLFIFLVAMTIIMKKIYIQKDSYLYIIFILLAFHGIIDDLIMLPQYNSFWFVVAALFMGRRIGKTTNNENTE
ncbi:hypothetical protein [Gemella sanguinis]|jgi:hypothetical protein|uniref:hypothetical protein n=1 Tax=Gemella sanguinis TaxID=84135 RepID=UPI0004E1CD8E|nr:hypothetical protein [Gemella sanguinis]NKZ26469.1 hypothetical protein [Gemella sanguinis]